MWDLKTLEKYCGSVKPDWKLMSPTPVKPWAIRTQLCWMRRELRYSEIPMPTFCLKVVDRYLGW